MRENILTLIVIGVVLRLGHVVGLLPGIQLSVTDQTQMTEHCHGMYTGTDGILAVDGRQSGETENNQHLYVIGKKNAEGNAGEIVIKRLQLTSPG